MTRSLVALLPLLVACGVSEDKFKDKFAEKSCEVLLECAPGGGTDSGFGSFFGSQEDCESLYSFAYAFMGECDYDKKAAKECLKALDDASCDESPEEITACEEVWSGDTCGWGGTGGTGGTWDTGW